MTLLRILCTIVVFVFLFAIASLSTNAVFFFLLMIASFSTNIQWLVRIVFFLVLSYYFIKNGIVEVPADPPHKAILVFLKKRRRMVLDEGWHWLPLYPFIFSFILIKAGKKTRNFEPQEVRTPDNALLDIKTAATWIPGIDGSPDSYITYLNSGGEEGVEKILHNAIEDRSKTWARSNREGPSNWMEAQANKDDAHEVLAKATMRENFEPIDSIVPTGTWMRFFDSPQSEPTQYDALPKNGWAHKDQSTNDWNWDGLQRYYDSLPAEERDRIRAAIVKRKDMVRSIREGNAVFYNRSLGITIVMFVVNEIKVKGAVADAADKEEKENRERRADTVEIDNFSERARGLMKDHPGLSSEEAFATAEVILNKVTKTIVRVDGAQTGLGHDLLGVANLGGIVGAKPETASEENPGGKKPQEGRGGKNPGKKNADEDDESSPKIATDGSEIL